MTGLGLTALETHESIFARGEAGLGFIIVACYVDDLLVAYTNKDDAERLLADVQKEITMKVQAGNKFEHLGAIVMSNEDGTFYLQQTKLANDIVKTLSLSTTKTKSTPLPFNSQSITKCEGDELASDLQKIYRSAVGKIGYLTYTRPDLLFARSLLARFIKNPTMAHWKLLIHVGKYIAGTQSLGLNFTKGKGMSAFAYSDSDHATDKDDRKSITGAALVACWRQLYLG